MIFADSHAHLDFPDYKDDLPQVIKRALDAGVGYINTISTRLSGVEALIDICEDYPNVFTSVGIHPHHVDKAETFSVEAICKTGSHKKVVGVGETGLDFFYDTGDRDQQEKVFRNHIQAAKLLDLPLIIHSREAEERTQTILQEEGFPHRGGVLHCFTGSLEMAEWAIRSGLYLSFSGILTFKNGESLRQVAKHVPLDRLLIETDAPYLAPVPKRGKRNEPAYVVRVAETLAKIHDCSLQQIAQSTTENYCRLFAIKPQSSSQSKSKENKKDTLAYAIGDGLYLNISRGCTLHCTFCPKWEAPLVHHYDLTLNHNPSTEEIMSAMGDCSAFKEIVFCGYGEPTLRLETLISVAKKIKQKSNIPIRINTDGLANRIYKKNITHQFKGLIDEVSVSLNAQDEPTYNLHCQPSIKGSYHSVLDFLKEVKSVVPKVTATAIQGLPGVDINACRRIAEELGVGFRERRLDRVG